MADATLIEWTDATWNPITGCSVVSPGCTHCYAMKLAGTRMKTHPSRAGLTIDTKAGPVWNGQVRFNEDWLTQPLQWKKPRRIFVAAHGDLFHREVQQHQLDRIFAIMALTPWHTYQVLTKRPDWMRLYLQGWDDDPSEAWRTKARVQKAIYEFDRDACLHEWPLPNVWLGVSIEDQVRANERIPVLLDTPAAVRWVSAEPLLGPLDVAEWLGSWCAGCRRPLLGGDHFQGRTCGTCHGPTARLDWVVVGGESGPGARPMHYTWARQLRDQCAAAGVAFLFKQWGAWAPVCAIDTDALDSRLYHPAPARRPEASRRPKVRNLVMHDDGEIFEDVAAFGAHAAGKNAMLMFEIGKTLSGRLLDGVQHDGYPEARS